MKKKLKAKGLEEEIKVCGVYKKTTATIHKVQTKRGRDIAPSDLSGSEGWSR